MTAPYSPSATKKAHFGPRLEKYNHKTSLITQNCKFVIKKKKILKRLCSFHFPELYMIRKDIK